MIDLKVALICTEKLPVPPILGGAVQLYIDGVVPYLSKKHEITVFSIENPNLPSQETKEGVRYIRVPAKTTTEYIKNLREKLNGFDLVHVFNRPLWVLYLSENLPSTKFSLSLHNEMFHPEKIPPAKAVECINRVEFINTVSKFIANGVKNLYPEAEGKLNVVYSGIDINKYKPKWSKEGILYKSRLKKKYNIQGYKVVLFIGRLSVKKGVHTLIRAMKEVLNLYDDAALVIVGSKWFGLNNEDEYTKFLKNLSKDIECPIVFTGFIQPDEIPSYYNLGDVFVCPSQWNEPLARVHYEAMGAGLPIITTNRGGNPEVVSGFGNGIVIDDYSNPKAFADTISYLFENPKKALDIGKTGRKLAKEMYTWERVANDILKAIDGIKSQKPIKVKKGLKEANKNENQTAEKEEESFFFDF